MKNYKGWVKAVLVGLAVFIAGNLCVWELFTKDLLTDNIRSGDYTRVGYITGSSYAAKPLYRGTRSHGESADHKDEPVDILTIGDSFSNGCGRKWFYYQDLIASTRSLNVLNMQRLTGADFFESVVILMNSGFLDTLHPKAIVLERLERHVIDSLSGTMDMNQTRPIEQVRKDFQELRYVNNPPSIGFLNIGNLKFLLYSFLRKIRDDAFFSKVYTHGLSRSFFNVRKDRSLIFAYEDIEHLSRENDASIRKVNENLNALAEKLLKKGIKLYFMPVVDKYNLYSDFLVRNPYPVSRFFEKLRPLPKKYQCIDTKRSLLPLIEKGEKDVYWADDSHWSWSAPKKILEDVQF